MVKTRTPKGRKRKITKATSVKLTPSERKFVRKQARTIVMKQANKCHAKTKSIKAFKNCMFK